MQFSGRSFFGARLPWVVPVALLMAGLAVGASRWDPLGGEQSGRRGGDESRVAKQRGGSGYQ